MQFLTEGTIQEYLYILRDLPIMDKKKESRIKEEAWENFGEQC